MRSSVESFLLARLVRGGGVGLTSEGLKFAQLAVCTRTGCIRDTPQGLMFTFLNHAAHDVPRSMHSALHTTLGSVGVAAADAAAQAALAEAEQDLGEAASPASSLNDSDAMAVAVDRSASLLSAAVAQCRLLLGLQHGDVDDCAAGNEDAICAAWAALASADGATAEGAISAVKLQRFSADLYRAAAVDFESKRRAEAKQAAAGTTARAAAASAHDAAGDASVARTPAVATPAASGATAGAAAACDGQGGLIAADANPPEHLVVDARRLSPAHYDAAAAALAAAVASLNWQDVACGQINEQRLNVPPVAAAAGMAPRATVHAGAYAGGGLLKVEVVDALLQAGTQPHATRLYQTFVPPVAGGGMAPALAPITGAALALRLVNHAAQPGCKADLVAAEASRVVRRRSTPVKSLRAKC